MSSDLIKHVTDASFEADVLKAEGAVLVDYWAEWCGPCKMMAPHFATVAKQNPQVVFAKIDTEANPRLSSAFHVRSIPTLVLMNKSNEIARISGALRATELQQWLDQQLNAQS